MPTIETEHSTSSTTTAITIQSSKSHKEPGISKLTTSSSSPFATVKLELVEAATAVAQALGSRILDDNPTGSLIKKNSIFSKKNSEELVKLTPGISYKWNDWRLIRTKDTLFLWCDAVAIEFR